MARLVDYSIYFSIVFTCEFIHLDFTSLRSYCRHSTCTSFCIFVTALVARLVSKSYLQPCICGTCIFILCYFQHYLKPDSEIRPHKRSRGQGAKHHCDICSRGVANGQGGMCFDVASCTLSFSVSDVFRRRLSLTIFRNGRP